MIYDGNFMAQVYGMIYDGNFMAQVYGMTLWQLGLWHRFMA